MTLHSHRFFPAWNNAFSSMGDVMSQGGVVVELDWRDGSSFRAACEFWLGAKPRGTLFFLGFCRDIQLAKRSLQRAVQDGCWWAEDLFEHWSLALSGIHRFECADRRVIVDIGVGNFERWISGLRADADVILARARDFENEETVRGLTRHLARMAKSEGVLWVNTTHSGEEKKRGWIEALQNSGFRGASQADGWIWEGSFVGKKRKEVPVSSRERKAIVIGGGIAGASVAARLGVRGWDVELWEERESLAQGASGNLAAVYVPMISRDDGVAARISRTCFLDLLKEIETLERRGIEVLHEGCGVLQLPRRFSEERALEEVVAKCAFSHSYARWWSAEEVAKQFGCDRKEIKNGGVFFPKAGWIHPASLCSARLEVAGNVRIKSGVRVEKVRRVDGSWEIYSDSEILLARAPVVVIATGADVMGSAWSHGLRLKRVRGQVTHVDAGALKAPNCVVSGDGYVTPAVRGVVSVGATYDFGESSMELKESCGRENLARLITLLPNFGQGGKLEVLFAREGRVGFRTLSADRLPVIGALADKERITSEVRIERLSDIPRLDGFYGALGLGSRGILWSGLVAECLAAQIAGEPLPLEQDLVDAMDPGRWILREKSAGR